ncbi:MAG TPA: NTF2-like N-terminal transpeptidase domain-containing protein, partial [Nocardioides sp.]
MRTPVVLGASLLLALPTASCSLLGDDGDPQATADMLAAALSAKDLADVPFTGARPDEEFTAVVDGLGESGAKVDADVGDVEDDRTTASLTWTWDLGGAQWKYDATAHLTRVDDEWKVVWAPSLVEPSLKDGEELSLDHLQAKRGEILAGDKEPIVTDRDVLKLGLDKTKIKKSQVASSAKAIARAVGIDEAGFVKRAEAAGDKAFVEALVMRAEDARTQLDASYEEIPGAVSLGSQMPLAPTRTFAAPLLGTVGPVTAEIVKKSKGRLAPG